MNIMCMPCRLLKKDMNLISYQIFNLINKYRL